MLKKLIQTKENYTGNFAKYLRILLSLLTLYTAGCSALREDYSKKFEDEYAAEGTKFINESPTSAFWNTYVDPYDATAKFNNVYNFQTLADLNLVLSWRNKNPNQFDGFTYDYETLRIDYELLRALKERNNLSQEMITLIRAAINISPEQEAIFDKHGILSYWNTPAEKDYVNKILNDYLAIVPPYIDINKYFKVLHMYTNDNGGAGGMARAGENIKSSSSASTTLLSTGGMYGFIFVNLGGCPENYLSTVFIHELAHQLTIQDQLSIINPVFAEAYPSVYGKTNPLEYTAEITSNYFLNKKALLAKGQISELIFGDSSFKTNISNIIRKYFFDQENNIHYYYIPSDLISPTLEKTSGMPIYEESIEDNFYHIIRGLFFVYDGMNLVHMYVRSNDSWIKLKTWLSDPAHLAAYQNALNRVKADFITEFGADIITWAIQNYDL